MKLQETIELCAKAKETGRTIQVRGLNPNTWTDIPANFDICFNENSSFYRLKPETKRVPLTAVDVPPGSVIRAFGLVSWDAVTGITPQGDRVKTNDDVYTFEDLASDYEISRDGGKTWEQCYKEVSE